MFILKITDLASLDGMDQCEYIFFLTTEIQFKPNYNFINSFSDCFHLIILFSHDLFQRKDSGPMHLHVAATYDNGVRLKWTIAPSCYNRKTTTLHYQSSDGQKFSFNISNDIDWTDLTGLDSDTSYNLTFVTKYKGGEVSDPVMLFFKTNESPPALTGGAIAGLAIGKNTLFFE